MNPAGDKRKEKKGAEDSVQSNQSVVYLTLLSFFTFRCGLSPPFHVRNLFCRVILVHPVEPHSVLFQGTIRQTSRKQSIISEAG